MEATEKNKIKINAGGSILKRTLCLLPVNIGDKQKVFSMHPSNCFVTSQTTKNDIEKKKNSLVKFTNERIYQQDSSNTFFKR